MARRSAWTTAGPPFVGSEPHCRRGGAALAGWRTTRVVRAHPCWAAHGRTPSRGCDWPPGGAQVRSRTLRLATYHEQWAGRRVRRGRSGSGDHAAACRRAIASRGHGVRARASARILRRAACRAAPRHRSRAIPSAAVPTRCRGGQEGTSSSAARQEQLRAGLSFGVSSCVRGGERTGSQVGVCRTCTQIPRCGPALRRRTVSWARPKVGVGVSRWRASCGNSNAIVSCSGPDSGPVVSQALRWVPLGLECRSALLPGGQQCAAGARAVATASVVSVPQLFPLGSGDSSPRFLAPMVCNEGHL